MNNKAIHFNQPYISKNTKNNLLKVLSNKKFSDGEFQIKTEKYIEKLIHSNSIKLTQSCSSALEVCMILADIKKGDEVIIPSYTFTSTANCVLLRNAKPVFADINKNDLNICIESIKKKINKRTKAIIIVHYGGIACDMDKLLQLKNKYNLLIIEDAAHAFYGKYKNKYLGTIGDLGAFSFHESKNILGGQCGALSINNLKFLKRANIILDKGTDRSYLINKKFYSWKDVGSEYRAPELSAALVYSQLKDIKKIQSKRSLIWNRYYDSFNKINKKKFSILTYNFKIIKNSFHIFCLIFNNIKIRKKFIKYMRERNIFCNFHYYPLHSSTLGKKFSKDKLFNTNKIYDGLVRLPIYPNLSLKNQKKIIDSVYSFLKIID